MPNIKMKIGEIEAVLDLLMAIEKKGQWLKRLETSKSPHVAYFPNGVKKAITMFAEALPVHTESLEK